MAPPLKSKFGQAEQKSPVTALLMWTFVALGIAGIIWMIASNPREKTLNCNSDVRASLTSFGSCTAE